MKAELLKGCNFVSKLLLQKDPKTIRRTTNAICKFSIEKLKTSKRLLKKYRFNWDGSLLQTATKGLIHACENHDQLGPI